MSYDIILALGDDSHSNQYMIQFPNGIPGGGNADLISLRMDQTFDPPEEKVTTYEFHYRGLKITKPGMVDETDKNLTFDVRIDQNWQVHKDLAKWKNMVHDAREGTAMDSSQVSTTLLVKALNATGVTVRTWRYSGVMLIGLKNQNAFDHQSPDPNRVTLSLVYQSIRYE